MQQPRTLKVDLTKFFDQKLCTL